MVAHFLFGFLCFAAWFWFVLAVRTLRSGSDVTFPGRFGNNPTLPAARAKWLLLWYVPVLFSITGFFILNLAGGDRFEIYFGWLTLGMIGYVITTMVVFLVVKIVR